MDRIYTKVFSPPFEFFLNKYQVHYYDDNYNDEIN